MSKASKKIYVVEVATGWGESSYVGPYQTKRSASRYAAKHGGVVHEVVPSRIKEDEE